MTSYKKFDDWCGESVDELDCYVDFILWLNNCVKNDYIFNNEKFEVSFVWPNIDGTPISATEWQRIINKFGVRDGLHCSCSNPMTYNCYVELGKRYFQYNAKNPDYIEWLEQIKIQANTHFESVKNRELAHEAGNLYYTSFARR